MKVHCSRCGCPEYVEPPMPPVEPYMGVGEAMALVDRLYQGRMDATGLPEFNHLYWVASHVSDESEVSAWLHDAVEDGLITWQELVEEHRIDPVDYGALTLLTRTKGMVYMGYIERIARASGLQGTRAREVKARDLDHNRIRPCAPGLEDMRAPGGRYDRAAAIIRQGQLYFEEPVTGFDRELLEFAAAQQAEQPEITFMIAQPRSAGR